MRIPTPSQTIGPYLSIGLAPLEHPRLVPPDIPGAVKVAGRLLDGDGEGIPDGVIELWQPDGEGCFTEPLGEESRHSPGFGRSLTDSEGSYGFVTIKPGPLSLPSGASQAPHLELLVFARGLTRSLHTRMYFPDDPANATDPVLSAVPADRRPTLVAVDTAEGVLRFDIRLQGGAETVFFSA